MYRLCIRPAQSDEGNEAVGKYIKGLRYVTENELSMVRIQYVTGILAWPEGCRDAIKKTIEFQ